MKTLKVNLTYYLIIALILVYSINIYSFSNLQDDKKVDEVTNTLKQKVLLSSDQETKVKQILNELQNKIIADSGSKNESISQAQSKIESLLDKKQKLKYDIIKNEIMKKF